MVFFDLDDTLMDHREATRAGALILHRYGVEGRENFQGFLSHWSVLCDAMFQRYADGEMTYVEQRVARMLSLWPSLSSGEVTKRLNAYLKAYASAWALFPDVLPCLDALADRPLGIITNGNQVQQRRKLDFLGISGRFKVVVISDEAGVGKPDARIFQQACAQAAEPVEACWHIGDRLDKDPRAATAAGLRGIWLNRLPTVPADPQVTTIRSLSELPPLVQAK